MGFDGFLRPDPVAPGCNQDEEDQQPAQTPQPESHVGADPIADHLSRLAQIRSAVEALPPLAPPLKRRRLAPAHNVFEGVTQLPPIPHVPIGMQALAQLHLLSGHPALPLGIQAVADSQARAAGPPPPAPPPFLQLRPPVSLFFDVMTAFD